MKIQNSGLPADEEIMVRRHIATRFCVTLATIALLLGYLSLRTYRSNAMKQRTWRIGYDSNPPHQIMGPNGAIRGLAVDAVKEAARRSGIRLEWIYRPESSMAALRNGRVDLWVLMADLPERRSVVYISEPFSITDYYFLTRDSITKLPTSDYSGVIAHVPLPLNRTLIRRRFAHATLRDKAGIHEIISGLCQNEYEIGFVGVDEAEMALREHASQCGSTKLQVQIIPGLFVSGGIGAALQYSEVADTLRDEINKMAEDGSLAVLQSPYSQVAVTKARVVMALMDARRHSRWSRNALAALGVVLIVLMWVAWKLRKTSRSAERAQTAAENASRAKGEFLANMSHEIRTPLAGVIGILDLTLGSPLPAEHVENIEVARSSAHTLLALLNDILDLSKIEAGRLELAPINMSVRHTVDDVIRLMSLTATQKGLELRAQVAAEVPDLVLCDPMRLRQVLLNLVGNALKFTSTGSIQVRVKVDPSEPLVLLFSVTDTGIGIPLEKQQLIFESFCQAEGSTARRYGGTGLGLTISKQLVELMEGRIWVESEPGLGSTFLFTAHYQGASTSEVIDSKLIPGAGGTSVPLRILLADDSAVNRKVIGTLLENDGHRVTLATNGKQVIERVGASRDEFDVILMDINMPEMNGFEATDAIRKTECHTGWHLPIVALTASLLDSDRDRCSAAGLDYFMSKPVDPVQLRILLQQIANSGRTNPNRVATVTPG